MTPLRFRVYNQSVYFVNYDVITPLLYLDPLRHVTATTITKVEYMLVFVLQKPISFTNFTSFSCCCVGFVYTVQGLCACSKSSLFLVYLCGRITASHTGLACILHRFVSVPVVSCVRRYVYGRMRKIKKTFGQGKSWLCVDEP